MVATVRGTTVSVKQWHGRRWKLEMDDIGINMDYIEKVAKRRRLYYIREKKMGYIMKHDKMI